MCDVNSMVEDQRGWSAGFGFEEVEGGVDATGGQLSDHVSLWRKSSGKPPWFT